jgi:hypothetical protein
MATYTTHDWLIFANTVAESGQAAVVVTAVCKRCGDVRSSLSPTDGSGRIDLTGECNVEGEQAQFAYR